MKQDFNLEELGRLVLELSRHDYYYTYSDDHRVYTRGHQHWEDILALSESLGLVGIKVRHWYSLYMAARQPGFCTSENIMRVREAHATELQRLVSQQVKSKITGETLT